MKIVICDDDIEFVQVLIQRICIVGEAEGIPLEFESYISPREMLSQCMALLQGQETVFFLDIDMPALTGFDVAQRLRACNRDVRIVFVSNRDELVYLSLEFTPLGFLRKTHLEQELGELMQRLHRMVYPEYTMVGLPWEGHTVEVALETILYVEGERNYIRLYQGTDAPGEGLRVRMKLSEAQAQWAQYGFLRIHKGFLVNVQAVDRLTERSIVLLNGQEIQVSRSYWPTVKTLLLGVERRD